MSGTQVTVSKLTPAGVLGYAKSIAVATGTVLGAIVYLVAEGTVKNWLLGIIAVCTVIANYQIPNQVNPIVVTTTEDSVRVLGGDAKVQATATPVWDDGAELTGPDDFN